MLEITKHYSYERQAGGIVLTHTPTGKTVFFQAGDDAAWLTETIDALGNLVTDHLRPQIATMIFSEYFNA